MWVGRKMLNLLYDLKLTMTPFREFSSIISMTKVEVFIISKIICRVDPVLQHNLARYYLLIWFGGMIYTGNIHEVLILMVPSLWFTDFPLASDKFHSQYLPVFVFQS